MAGAALMNSEITVCVCERRTEFPFKSPFKIVSMMGFRLRAFCNTTCTYSLACLSPPKKIVLLIANGNETDLSFKT